MITSVDCPSGQICGSANQLPLSQQIPCSCDALRGIENCTNVISNVCQPPPGKRSMVNQLPLRVLTKWHRSWKIACEEKNVIGVEIPFCNIFMTPLDLVLVHSYCSVHKSTLIWMNILGITPSGNVLHMQSFNNLWYPSSTWPLIVSTLILPSPVGTYYQSSMYFWCYLVTWFKNFSPSQEFPYHPPKYPVGSFQRPFVLVLGFLSF